MAACSPRTRLCIAAGLTTEAQYLRSMTLQEWKRVQLPDLAKTPAIFAIYAG